MLISGPKQWPPKFHKKFRNTKPLLPPLKKTVFLLLPLRVDWSETDITQEKSHFHPTTRIFNCSCCSVTKPMTLHRQKCHGRNTEETSI